MNTNTDEFSEHPIIAKALADFQERLTYPSPETDATAAECAAEGCPECSRLRAELAEARRDMERLRLWIHGKVKYLRGWDNKYGYTLTGDDPLYETADQAIDAVVSQPKAKEGQ